MSDDRLLLAAPARFMGESAASWIHRICAAHATSIHWFRRHYALPAGCDFDLDLGEAEWTRILEGTPFCSEWVFDLEYVRALQVAELWTNFQHWMRRRPYRWCSACFAADKEPYFRRSWRFGPPLCAVHGTVLHSSCPACHRVPDLTRAPRARHLNMAFCQHCGHWLADVPAIQVPRKERSALDVVRDKFGAAVNSVPQRHLPHPLGMLDWRLYESHIRTESLVIDARQFARPDTVRSWVRFRKGSRSRTVLAAALVLVRRELHAMRRAEHDKKVSAGSPTPEQEQQT
jgi:hypothetical protein